MVYSTLIWTASALALIVFGEITERAAKRLKELKKRYGKPEEKGEGEFEKPAEGVTVIASEAKKPQEKGEGESEKPAEEQGTENPPPESLPDAAAPTPSAAPPPEKGSDPEPRTVSEVEIGLRVMGALLCVPWVLVVGLNSLLIGLSLGVILPPGNPLFDLVIGPWRRTVYLNDLVGVLICLMQAIGGAVWLHGILALSSEELQEKGHKQRPALIRLTRIALVVTIALLVFEAGTAAYRGWILGDLANAIISTLAALGAGGIEVVIGAFVIGFFIVPTLVAICNFIAAPFKGNISDPIMSPVLAVPPEYRGPLLLRVLAFIDDVLMKHLRKLDKLVLGRFQGRREQTMEVNGNASEA